MSHLQNCRCAEAAGANKGDVPFVIETPRGSAAKLEFDPELPLGTSDGPEDDGLQDRCLRSGLPE
jgi:hypothetical protein